MQCPPSLVQVYSSFCSASILCCWLIIHCSVLSAWIESLFMLQRSCKSRGMSEDDARSVWVREYLAENGKAQASFA